MDPMREKLNSFKSVCPITGPGVKRLTAVLDEFVNRIEALERRQRRVRGGGRLPTRRSKRLVS